jgi:hypothetical protein
MEEATGQSGYYTETPALAYVQSLQRTTSRKTANLVKALLKGAFIWSRMAQSSILPQIIIAMDS